MAAPDTWLEARDDGPRDEAVVVLVCECGWRQDLPYLVTLLDLLNRVGEHNYSAHLRPDNVGLRVRR